MTHSKCDVGACRGLAAGLGAASHSSFRVTLGHQTVIMMPPGWQTAHLPGLGALPEVSRDSGGMPGGGRIHEVG